MDHQYNHPDYRVDFLLKLSVDDKAYHIIIEYDGFKEHFTHLDEIDAGNYQHYYKSEDVEREKILESYGYRILRICRFNTGKDPVVTLSKRLHRLTRNIIKEQKPHELVTEIGESAGELVNHKRRICQTCEKPKPLKSFRDKNLKSGMGRICKDCKKGNQKQKTKKNKPDYLDQPIGKKTCPRCGKSMVLRKGPRGKFYGCSAFPRCRGTREN